MPRHQTLHKGIKKTIVKLRAHKLIKRVTIGPYENCRHKYSIGTIKIQRPTTSGLKLNGYDGSGVYVFYLYFVNAILELEKEEVKTYINDQFKR